MASEEEKMISGRPPIKTREPEDLPVGYEQLTVADSAVGFASIPSRANKAIVIVEDATIRWREDGTDPTTTVGTQSFVNTTLIIEGRNKIDAFSAIRTGSTSAKLSVNYYERKIVD